ncbi:MAG: dephospho-CoA kinase [Flavobacterium sp.]|nr:dephospho-CoA kinase [Flavobacterium sp.]
MTKIIGLTGGIGSGKTTVAKIFQQLGVPVYFADEIGREILDTPEVRNKIAALFGNQILRNDAVDRTALAQIVFNDADKLRQLNSIVHPAVAAHFQQWVGQQTSGYVIKEAAILFESGSYKNCDEIITVSAPVETRIKRVIQRDNTTRENVLSRMANQWQDRDREKLSNYVILNSGSENLEAKVMEIHKKLNNT